MCISLLIWPGHLLIHGTSGIVWHHSGGAKALRENSDLMNRRMHMFLGGQYEWLIESKCRRLNSHRAMSTVLTAPARMVHGESTGTKRDLAWEYQEGRVWFLQHSGYPRPLCAEPMDFKRLEACPPPHDRYSTGRH
jgi:hypothetical protein